MRMNLLLENIDNPELLEQLYQESPSEFETHLKNSLENNTESETLKVWGARLSYRPPISQRKISLSLLVVLCLVTGIAAKIPAFSFIDGNWYYPRFIPLLVICAPIIYFIKTIQPFGAIQKAISIGVLTYIAYLIVLPAKTDSASITMALIHIPLFSLSLLAMSFMSNNWKTTESRLGFIRYLGEMGIFTVLILLGGIVLAGLTVSLFSAIGFSIEKWYMNYVGVLGVVSSPIVATYIYDSVQDRESRFAPMLSNVFSPLFLITVVAYLGATIYQGRSPFTDREFLITFNGLLLVVLAVTIFSVSGKVKTLQITALDYINISLVGMTLLLNMVALCAIVFRWLEYGVTVNRIVVTGANILIFGNLVLLLKQYIHHVKSGCGYEKLQETIAKYLPVYTAWSLFVAILLPVIFWFK